MNFLSFLTSIDMFAVEFNISIFNQKGYKSVYGTILTIILFALAIYKIEVLLSEAIRKTNFTVTEEKDILNGADQNLSDFYITYCLSESDRKRYSYSSLANEYSKAPIEYNETFSNKIGAACFSYNLTNTLLSAGEEDLGLTNSTKTLSNIVYGIPPFASQEIMFFIDEKFIKRTDYNNPVRHKNYRIQFRNSYSYRIDIYLETIQVKYKTTYNFGFFKYEPSSSKNYTSYHSNKIESNDATSSVFISLITTIYHSDLITTYTFNKFDLDTALSDFGGYINTCFMILNFIGTFINNYLLKIHILRNLNIGISYDNLINNKVKKDSKNNKDKINNINNSKTTNEIQNLNFTKKKNINHENLVKNDLPIITARSSENDCLNIQINKSNTTDQNDSKEINRINNMEINPNSKEKQTDEKNEKTDDEIFKLYMGECDEIINKINNEDELYNSLFNKEINDKKKAKIKNKINERLFEEHMDYSYFYILFKEVKLLELLLLKPDNAEFFIRYKEKFLDFNKLSALLKNKHVLDKMLSSRLYTEYGLNKCII